MGGITQALNREIELITTWKIKLKCVRGTTNWSKSKIILVKSRVVKGGHHSGFKADPLARFLIHMSSKRTRPCLLWADRHLTSNLLFTEIDPWVATPFQTRPVQVENL